MPPSRVYVRIRVRISPDGTMQPLAILWEDGQEFEIDSVLDVRRAASEAGSRVAAREAVCPSQSFFFA